MFKLKETNKRKRSVTKHWVMGYTYTTYANKYTCKSKNSVLIHREIRTTSAFQQKMRAASEVRKRRASINKEA